MKNLASVFEVKRKKVNAQPKIMMMLNFRKNKLSHQQQQQKEQSEADQKDCPEKMEVRLSGVVGIG